MERKHELEGSYNPKDFEEEIYENWNKKGYFAPSEDKSKKPYTIVIPPPNITGKLHMGHALDETLQDILIRYKRMQGYNTLWVPGTDHASISTEMKVVQKLKEEGNEIFIISGRNNGEYKNPKQLTEEWLKNNQIPYDQLILTNAYQEHEKTITVYIIK